MLSRLTFSMAIIFRSPGVAVMVDISGSNFSLAGVARIPAM